MRSMTGYGRAARETDGHRVDVEMSGVNRKQIDLRIVLPKELSPLEPELRSWLQARASRGAITVALHCTLGGAEQTGVRHLDRELAKHVAAELRAIADEAGVAREPTLHDILAVPGVVLEEPENVPLSELRPLVFETARDAFDQFDAMRREEGETLLADIATRLETMKTTLAKVRTEAAGVVDLYRQRLQERAADLGLDMNADDERLVKEAVFLADRADITEEIVRLDSHFGQLDNLLRAEEPPGRALEFLCQEMHREVNTIGSKARGTAVAERVFVLKTELARIKEQAMNIE